MTTGNFQAELAARNFQPAMAAGNFLPAMAAGNFQPALTGTSSYDVLTTIKYLTSQDMSPVFYKHLLSLRKELKRANRKAKDETTKSQIEYLMQAIDRGIGAE